MEEGYEGPRLSYDADSSQQMGSWKTMLLRSLRKEEDSESENENSRSRSKESGPKKGDDGKIIITEKSVR